MRERERVLFHQGKYAESARLGYQVLAQMENDRNASVYLAYDLYNLGRYDETLTLTERYSSVLPKEPNFPLLTGHVHKQNQLLQQAVQDYTEAFRAIQRWWRVTSTVVTCSTICRTQRPRFRISTLLCELQPSNGVAHLGLGFFRAAASPRTRRAGREAAKPKSCSANPARFISRALPRIATCGCCDKAEQEYEAALEYAPDDLKLHLALADTEFHARRYAAAIETLNAALAISPDDPEIYAQLANAHAELHHRDQTAPLHQRGGKTASELFAAVLLNTGTALLTLGDQSAAMQRFTRALEAPDANRVESAPAFRASLCQSAQVRRGATADCTGLCRVARRRSFSGHRR